MTNQIDNQDPAGTEQSRFAFPIPTFTPTHPAGSVTLILPTNKDLQTRQALKKQIQQLYKAIALSGISHDESFSIAAIHKANKESSFKPLFASRENPRGVRRYRSKQVKLAKLLNPQADLLDWIVKAQLDGYNVYYRFNSNYPTRRMVTDLDVKTICAFVLDIDDVQPENANLPIKPTVLVGSGHGVQALYVVKAFPRRMLGKMYENFVQAQKDLIPEVDTACRNPSRLFRLGGTLNQKFGQPFCKAHILNINPIVHDIQSLCRQNFLLVNEKAFPFINRQQDRDWALWDTWYKCQRADGQRPSPEGYEHFQFENKLAKRFPDAPVDLKPAKPSQAVSKPTKSTEKRGRAREAIPAKPAGCLEVQQIVQKAEIKLETGRYRSLVKLVRIIKQIVGDVAEPVQKSIHDAWYVYWNSRISGHTCVDSSFEQFKKAWPRFGPYVAKKTHREYVEDVLKQAKPHPWRDQYPEPTQKLLDYMHTGFQLSGVGFHMGVRVAAELLSCGLRKANQVLHDLHKDGAIQRVKAGTTGKSGRQSSFSVPVWVYDVSKQMVIGPWVDAETVALRNQPKRKLAVIELPTLRQEDYEEPWFDTEFTASLSKIKETDEPWFDLDYERQEVEDEWQVERTDESRPRRIVRHNSFREDHISRTESVPCDNYAEGQNGNRSVYEDAS